MSLATRSEWPEVVGSRCSIAVTDARTKESKSLRMSSSSLAFSNATAAWLASELARSSSTEVKETTSSSTSETGRSTACGLRFLLISCTTPITAFSWSRIGTTSIDLDR